MRSKDLRFWTFGLLMLMASPLYALNSEMNRASLQGLKGVRVLVEDIASEVEERGLARVVLQKEVEDKIRAAGIKVLTQEEATQTPGEPYLYLNINVTLSRGEEEACSYSIDLALIQNVTLVRNPGQATYAATWSTGGVGLIGKKSLKDLKETTLEVVDLFVKAFMSVNPKK